ncbi:MAG: serine protease [Thermoproteota archaeon]|nr:serine protease [Thermoproteota archaeon]
MTINKIGIKSVKDATVAIGIIDKTGDRIPREILGSGFFISSKGYVITAKHVLDGCDKMLEVYREQKQELEIAILSVVTKGSKAEVRVMREVKTYALGVIDAPKYVGPIDPDIAIVIPGEGIDDLGGTPYVSLRKPSMRVSLYTDVIMCGYPAGDESLDMFRKHRGLRLSPIIQFGHLTGLMPTDDVDIPWGIQTGSSSGSAIIDSIDSTVVGIAQNVFTAGVTAYTAPLYSGDAEGSKAVPIFGKAKMGLVYGTSFHQFHDILDRIQKELG